MKRETALQRVETIGYSRRLLSARGVWARQSRADCRQIFGPRLQENPALGRRNLRFYAGLYDPSDLWSEIIRQEGMIA